MKGCDVAGDGSGGEPPDFSDDEEEQAYYAKQEQEKNNGNNLDAKPSKRRRMSSKLFLSLSLSSTFLVLAAVSYIIIIIGMQILHKTPILVRVIHRAAAGNRIIRGTETTNFGNVIMLPGVVAILRRAECILTGRSIDLTPRIPAIRQTRI